MRHTLLLRRPDHVVQALVLLLTGLLFLTAGCTAAPTVSKTAADAVWPLSFDQVVPLSTPAWQLVGSRLQSIMSTVGTRFPHITENHIWQTSGTGDWTGGFFVGELWLMAAEAEKRNDPLAAVWRSQALTWTRRLEQRITDTGTHDLGFLFMPSWVEAYRQTGDERWRIGALQAAESLSKRYTPGGFIQSWGKIGEPPYAGTVIIDNMMNLALLYWAAEEGNRPEYAQMATSHALLTQQSHIRADYGTFHLVDFDRDTGVMLRGRTSQGLHDNSTWARGQAWGIAGFALVYRYTHNPEFLAVAERLADYFLAHLPPDHVAPWDLHAGAGAKKDTSANAITAFGLLAIANSLRQLGETTRADVRAAQARRLLEALHPYSIFANETLRTKGGLLTGGTYNYNADRAVEQSVVWGDYYYLKALLDLAAYEAK
ncbi:MAG: glycoside hydrolase family 88 protein [Limnochordia bacterium]